MKPRRHGMRSKVAPTNAPRPTRPRLAPPFYPVQPGYTPRFWVLTPVFGVVLFGVIYVMATQLYPGGSPVDTHAVGFSWAHNYWCNLLNEEAINGQPNPARPVALLGMGVLSLTLSCFWFLFPLHLPVSKTTKLIIQRCGSLAMFIALFLFTPFHDSVTNLATFFGLIATIGTFIGLYRAGWYGLFAFGLLNLLLIGLNNYVYYTKGLLLYLPVIQKISFATFLLWIGCISVAMHRAGNATRYN